MSEEAIDLFTHYERLMSTFVHQQLIALEIGQQDTEGSLPDFADLTYGLFSFFKANPAFSANPFIKDQTLFAISREMAYYGYRITHSTINHILKDSIQLHLEELRAAFQQDKPHTLIGEPANEELMEWSNKLSKANASDLQRREELKKATIHQIGMPFHHEVSQFSRLYSRCESPLEEVFLMGMFTLRESWPRLLNPSVFTNQYVIGDYRVDFVFFGENNRRIIVELDGHTYHERTEEQAVRDRSRNRVLQNADWKVLQFHRKEIETDLDRCVRQVHRTVRGLPIVESRSKENKHVNE